MKNKKIMVAIVLACLTIGVMSTVSNAALQSTRSAGAKADSATNWVINVRNMETKNGGMGLDETVGADGIAGTKSNNIDVHLQKNTEYGAALLLGASDYGKQGAVGGTGSARYMNSGSTTITGIDLKASTTGNVTGIYDMGEGGYWEWTAGGGTDFLSHIALRYRDIYETSGVGKPGDATVENGVYMFGWHGSGYTGFATGSYGFLRGYRTAFSSGNGDASGSSYARAVVVCGSGL